jgi:hypothetical protein
MHDSAAYRRDADAAREELRAALGLPQPAPRRQ